MQAVPLLQPLLLSLLLPHWERKPELSPQPNAAAIDG